MCARRLARGYLFFILSQAWGASAWFIEHKRVLYFSGQSKLAPVSVIQAAQAFTDCSVSRHISEGAFGRAVLSQIFESLPCPRPGSCHLRASGDGEVGLQMHLTLLLACRVLPGAGAGAFCDSQGPGDSSRCCGIKTLALGMCRCPPQVRKCRLALQDPYTPTARGPSGSCLWFFASGGSRQTVGIGLPLGPLPETVFSDWALSPRVSCTAARHTWCPSGCRDPSAAVIGLDDRGWFQFPRTRISLFSCSPVSEVTVRGEPQGEASTLMGQASLSGFLVTPHWPPASSQSLDMELMMAILVPREKGIVIVCVCACVHTCACLSVCFVAGQSGARSLTLRVEGRTFTWGSCLSLFLFSWAHVVHSLHLEGSLRVWLCPPSPVM